jgi:hypothetical protein
MSTILQMTLPGDGIGVCGRAAPCRGAVHRVVDIDEAVKSSDAHADGVCFIRGHEAIDQP